MAHKNLEEDGVIPSLASGSPTLTWGEHQRLVIVFVLHRAGLTGAADDLANSAEPRALHRSLLVLVGSRQPPIESGKTGRFTGGELAPAEHRDCDRRQWQGSLTRS